MLGGPWWRACSCTRDPTIRGSLRSRERLAPVQPLLLERCNAYVVHFPLKPGLHRKVPGLFVFMPRWRNRNTRMSQKHDLPGSNPGWGTRFRRKQNASVPLRHGDRMKRIVLLQLGMWPVPGRHSSTGERDVASVEVRVRFSLPAPTGSRRLMARTAVFQAADAGSIPAGNARHKGK